MNDKNMTKERMGEIALLFLKQKLREEGIRLTPNFKRQVGNTAKSIGIETAEALVFAEIIVRELVEETFADAEKELPTEGSA